MLNHDIYNLWFLTNERIIQEKYTTQRFFVGIFQATHLPGSVFHRQSNSVLLGAMERRMPNLSPDEQKTHRWIVWVLPRNLTWNLKMMVSKRNLHFQGLLFRFHVKFQGCIYQQLPVEDVHKFPDRSHFCLEGFKVIHVRLLPGKIHI